MIIQFKCNGCGNIFTKEEFEIIEQNQSFRRCSLCGEKLMVSNLEEVVTEDLSIRIKNNINKWFKEYGIEATIELINRNREQACAKLYIEEIQKRGLNV